MSPLGQFNSFHVTRMYFHFKCYFLSPMPMNCFSTVCISIIPIWSAVMMTFRVKVTGLLYLSYKSLSINCMCIQHKA
jgi:hypothetical protein